MEDIQKMAIWQNHKVIGYIDITETQRQILNGIHGIGVYIGYDPVTKPEMYEKREG